MPQVELFAIDNPCISICQMNKKGYCIGCLRNRSERQRWHAMSDDEKHRVLVLLARRRRQIHEHLRQKAQPQIELDFVGTPNQLEIF